MGYYYMSDGPPPPRRWWQRLGKYVPGPIKRWWDDLVEIAAISQVVFSIILPIIGLLIGFIFLCTLGLYLFSWLTGGS